MHSERWLQAAAAACVRADATSACLRSTFATRVYAAHRRVEAVARALDQACQMHSERRLQAAAAACVRANATSACLRSTFATRVYPARRRVEAVARALDHACT